MQESLLHFLLAAELKSNTRDLMLGYFVKEDAKTFLQQLLQQSDYAVVDGIWDQVYEVRSFAASSTERKKSVGILTEIA